MSLRHRLLLFVALTGATGCHFEDRTPGGAQRDDTSLEQAARNFYVALASHDASALGRSAFSSASVLVATRGAAPTLVPIGTMITVPDLRTSGVMPRIVRTELRTDGDVATARVVVAQVLPAEMEAVDFLTLAREGTQWRVAHAVFGPWRTKGSP